MAHPHRSPGRVSMQMAKSLAGRDNPTHRVGYRCPHHGITQGDGQVC